MEEVNPSPESRSVVFALFSGRSMEMAVYDYNWAALIGCPLV
jgi:hypothetical protein